ncbi:MAG: iron chelate uptake ABC transporter family permease subunit [Gammaproteobacteria bacterium]|nr:iron chelate uptake ABC transporter family permease subunit [Gammaproteobacteria bacterium]
MDDFIYRALIAGFGIALISGPMGAFIIWQRKAYFGETLAHSALLGVALGMLLDINTNITIIATCVILALLLVALQRQQRLANDTLLGILSHTTLAFGVIALSFMEQLRINLASYLFGDILAVTLPDIYWIYAGSATALLILIAIWRPLLAITVDEELARVEGVKVVPVQLLFTVLVAIIIAVSMKVVGILLVTSLLIIPAAAARGIARSPEQMALIATLFGLLAVGAGMLASLFWDLPTGPAMVASAALLFTCSLAVRSR